MSLEVDTANGEIEALKQPVFQLGKDVSTSRPGTMEQLRSELLARLEPGSTAATDAALGTSRDSLTPGTMLEGDLSSIESPRQDRKTLANQRELFEQLKRQFSDLQAAPPASRDLLPPMEQVLREDYQEQLEQANKDSIDLKIQLAALQEDLREKAIEAERSMEAHAALAAEVADLRFNVEQEAASCKRLSAQNTALEAELRQTESDRDTLRRRLRAAEEQLSKGEEDRGALRAQLSRLQEDYAHLQRSHADSQTKMGSMATEAKTIDARVQEQTLQLDRYRKAIEEAERIRDDGRAYVEHMDRENMRLRADLASANAENAKFKNIVEELLQAEAKGHKEELEREVQRWQERCKHLEQECNKSKQLNKEMQHVMAQMTHAVDGSGDTARRNRALQKELEAKAQEQQTMRASMEELQSKLDSLQTNGDYYQEKCNKLSAELRTLKQEHSVGSATLSKLQVCLESTMKENTDLKAQCSRLSQESRSQLDITMRAHHYEQDLRDLESTTRVATSPYKGGPLGTMEDTGSAKKSRAQTAISRLNSLMMEEEEEET